MSVDYQDAFFFELVLHPVKAFVNLNVLYTAVAENRLYASKNLIDANYYANRVKELFKNDSLLSVRYNDIAGGKWNHMMDQTHIGYTYWQQPPANKMPEVKYVSLKEAIDFGVTEQTLLVSSKHLIPKNATGNIFYERNGYVSIEASHYTKAINTSVIHWKIIPGIGRDSDGITTFPVTKKIEAKTTSLDPYLEYEIYVYDTGAVKLETYFSPTLNFHNDPLGLQYAISIDNEAPKIVSINKDENNVREWSKWVADDIIIKSTGHKILKAGKHIVKYWMISPAIVLQKIVLDFGGEKQSYLGPPETKIN